MDTHTQGEKKMDTNNKEDLMLNAYDEEKLRLKARWRQHTYDTGVVHVNTFVLPVFVRACTSISKITGRMRRPHPQATAAAVVVVVDSSFLSLEPSQYSSLAAEASAETLDFGLEHCHFPRDLGPQCEGTYTWPAPA